MATDHAARRGCAFGDGELRNAYAARLVQIPGGTAATANSLEAWTWQPALVPAVKDAIIHALECLVNEAGGDEAHHTAR